MHFLKLTSILVVAIVGVTGMPNPELHHPIVKDSMPSKEFARAAGHGRQVPKPKRKALALDESTIFATSQRGAQDDDPPTKRAVETWSASPTTDTTLDIPDLGNNIGGFDERAVDDSSEDGTNPATPSDIPPIGPQIGGFDERAVDETSEFDIPNMGEQISGFEE